MPIKEDSHYALIEILTHMNCMFLLIIFIRASLLFAFGHTFLTWFLCSSVLTMYPFWKLPNFF